MLSGLSSHWNRQGRCGDATDLLTTRGTSAPVHQEDIERVETLPEEITAAKRGLTPLNEKLSRDIMAGSDASAWLASNQLRDAVARNNKDTAELEQGLKGL